MCRHVECARSILQVCDPVRGMSIRPLNLTFWRHAGQGGQDPSLRANYRVATSTAGGKLLSAYPQENTTWPEERCVGRALWVAQSLDLPVFDLNLNSELNWWGRN